MATTGLTGSTQYLTFKLENETFAVDVAKVREILDYVPATKVPGTPDFMCGIINVRGNVVPVVDMRLKFGSSEMEKTVDTCIVVMEIETEGDKIILGAFVDSVQEVFELEPGQIEAPPQLGTQWRTEVIKGIGKRNSDLVMILDIDRVFSNLDLGSMQDTASVSAQGTVGEKRQESLT